MPVLDTSFVLDVLRGRDDAVRLLALLQQGSAPLGIAPMTHYELYAGIGRTRRTTEETVRVENFLKELHVFAFEPRPRRWPAFLTRGWPRKASAWGSSTS